MVVRSMEKTNDAVMCPVKAWASVVQSIRNTRSKKNTPVNYYTEKTNAGNQTASFSQQDTIILLRSSAKHHSNDVPYKPEDIGSHSLRSGAAVALFLSGVDPVDIMLTGRWSSDAFLLYIRPYIVEMAKDLSSRMIQSNSYTLPNSENQTSNNRNRERRPDDPLMAGDPRNLCSVARIKKAAKMAPIKVTPSFQNSTYFRQRHKPVKQDQRLTTN